MLVTVVSRYDDEDESTEVQLSAVDLQGMTPEQIKEKKAIKMKNKVKAIAKMSRMFATLREESETLLKLKNMSPDGKLPRGLLLEGKPAIRNALK